MNRPDLKQTKTAPDAPGAAPVASLDDFLVDLPPIPAVALKVMHLVDDPDTHGAQLTEVISSDQAITFKVLQMSNSAYFGLSRTIESLGQAVTILGMRTIRSLVLLHAIPAGLMQGGRSEADEKRLWEHAIATGFAARQLGSIAGGVDAESLFIAGLLHDVGKSILLRKSPEVMSAIIEGAWPQGSGRGLAAESAAFGFDHACIGQRVMEYWEFPEVYSLTSRWHHVPEEAPACERDVQLIAVANRLTHHLGLGGPADPEALEDATARAEFLGLEPGALEQVAVGTLNQLTAERSLYNL